VATVIGCLPTQALAFLAVFVYATHATQAIAFEWKPGFSHSVRLQTSKVIYRLASFHSASAVIARLVHAYTSAYWRSYSTETETALRHVFSTVFSTTSELPLPPILVVIRHTQSRRVNAGPYWSTTAALVALFHTVRTLLSTNQFVHVYSFDFSKAFDTVRHYTLMDKMAQMQMPDNIYNWVKDFFDEHYHCTKYAGETSTVAEVKSSVIQGSGLDPASFLVTAADLHPHRAGNYIFKYAYDTYLVVPASNTSSRQDEIIHIKQWADRNNLRLNHSKSKEIVFRARGVRGKSAAHNLHLRVWTSSASTAIQCLASSSTTNRRLSTTSTVCCRRMLVYCTRSESSAATAFRRRRCMRTSVPRSSPRLHSALQPGLDSVRLQIDFVLTHFYPDVNVLVLLTILSP